MTSDSGEPPARRVDGQSKPPVARLLSVGARGAGRVAHAAGVDAAVDERRGWHDRFAGTEVVYDGIKRTAPYSRQYSVIRRNETQSHSHDTLD